MSTLGTLQSTGGPFPPESGFRTAEYSQEGIKTSGRGRPVRRTSLNDRNYGQSATPNGGESDTKRGSRYDQLTKSGRRDLNPGPSGPKPDALPDCATPRC
jgi:hypothetical protein